MSEVELNEWEQEIQKLKLAGNLVIAPNNLPIRCVMADGTLKEHEHADHRDYKFPVMCELIGTNIEEHQWCCVDDNGKRFYRQMDEIDIYNSEHEEHALIYTDGSIAITIYETCKAIWNLRDGTCLGGHLWEKWDKKNKKGWKLDETSLKKVQDYYKCQINQ